MKNLAKQERSIFSTSVTMTVGLTLVFVSAMFLSAQNATAASTKLWREGTEGKPEVDIALPSFAPMIDKLGPAVVNISIEGKETVLPQLPKGGEQFGFGKKEGERGMPFPFEFFSPSPEGSKRSFASLGSGFVINPEGYIVTNNHVIDKATKILVVFKDDKKNYSARVIGRDKKTDIALLKVDVSHPLVSVTFGDSDKLQPGDWVVSIGNPFRLGHTATAGIVSAKSRRVPGGGPYDDFIQTDASINPGNSGGPLFNSRGEVIGVSTAIFSPGRMGSTGFNIGIGFATPINLVKSVLTQLNDKGEVVRGWLGVLIQPVSSDVADALGLKEAQGALVADVMEKSPASKARIKRGDVISKYDGKAVEDNDVLPLMVAETPIGKEVELEVIRQGKRETLKTIIQKLDDKEETELPGGSAEEEKLGLTVQELTPDIAKGLGLDDAKGVVVSDVQADSVAESSGLRRGDVILEIDSHEITSTKEFREATKDVKPNKPLLLLVRRENNTIFLTLKIE